MDKYRTYIPGRRIVKTAIAVFLSVQLFYLLGHTTPVHAALACILTMRTTADETKSRGKNRIIGTLIGGLSAYLCLIFIDRLQLSSVSNFAPIIVAVFVLLSLTITKALQMDPYAMTIASVVTVVTLLSHNESHLDALSYVSIRILETIVGFVIAYMVNRYLLPRRNKTDYLGS